MTCLIFLSDSFCTTIWGKIYDSCIYINLHYSAWACTHRGKGRGGWGSSKDNPLHQSDLINPKRSCQKLTLASAPVFAHCRQFPRLSKYQYFDSFLFGWHIFSNQCNVAREPLLTTTRSSPLPSAGFILLWSVTVVALCTKLAIEPPI